jgi:hypothetical protein
MAGASYNDSPWAILFILMVVATAGLAVYKNFMGGTELDVVAYCDSSPCKNGATCKELSVAVNGHVGYQCLCAGGWLGDSCEVAPCETCEGGENGAEIIMEDTSLRLTDSQLHNFVGLSIGAVVGGTLWGLAFLWIVRSYTKQIIWTTMWMMVVVQLGMSAAFFTVFGVPMLGVLCFLAGLISVLIIVVVRNWIPFATLLIRTACLVIKKNPAVLKIALMAVLVQAIWLVVWIFAATSSIGSSDTLSTFLCLVSLFWSVQVIKNVVHVTCAGTIASWYFVTNERQPTLASFRRSITYSFGSICFGSLVVAILKSIRAMIPRRPSATNGGGGFSQMFLRGILGCVERMMEWLNHYAFTQIAIYGYDFKRAARATWQLLQDVGLMPLMNNTLVQAVCWLGCIIGAAIASLISVMMVKSTDLDGTLPLSVAGMFGAMVGFVMVMPIIEVVESMVTALFICYAYNADVLLLNDPLLYQEITKAYDLMAVGKRHFIRHFYIKCIILPRQARDKHRENSKKEWRFLRRTCGGTTQRMTWNSGRRRRKMTGIGTMIDTKRKKRRRRRRRLSLRRRRRRVRRDLSMRRRARKRMATIITRGQSEDEEEEEEEEEEEGAASQRLSPAGLRVRLCI